MNRLFKISVILLVISFSLVSCYESNEKPQAVNGVVNITQDDLDNGIIKLDGEWEFFWKELISPQEFSQKKIGEGKYSLVPNTWNTYADKDTSISAKGFATYHLQIYKQAKDSIFGIQFNRIKTAYKIWVNGKLLSEIGKVASDKKNMAPGRNNLIHYFTSKSEKIEIVLQISNFKHRKGGIEGSILFGTEKTMIGKAKKDFGISFFLFGLLIIVAVNHLILYKLRGDVTSSLFFALLILSITLNLSISETHNILSLFFSNINWDILLKLDYISDYLCLFFFLKYISSLYKEESSPLIIRVVLIYTLVMSLFIIVTSPAVFTYSIIQLYVIGSLIVLYILFVLAKAMVSEKEGAKQALFGVLVVTATIINDSLNNSLVINTYYLIPYGLATFIIIQSYLISFRLSKAYSYSIQLADELDYFNENLEKIVHTRTTQIEKQKEELVIKSDNLSVANDEIVKINQVLEGQTVVIQKKNKALTDSLNYAKRLQDAVLPDENLLIENFPEHFIFFKPKDIVSGDFYWYGEVDSSWDFDESNKIKIMVAADCTGHGVPGAFMTLLGYNFLHMIVNIQEVVDPEQILYKLDQLVIETLKQRESGTMKDGMDIAVMKVDEEKETITFAGAGNPIFYIRDGELTEVKGSNFGIGGVLRKAKVYVPHKIPYQKGDIFYIFSDGFSDQIGGEDGRKFYKKRLKNFLVENHKKPIEEQKDLLNERFLSWKGDKKQIDDVLIMGIKM